MGNNCCKPSTKDIAEVTVRPDLLKDEASGGLDSAGLERQHYYAMPIGEKRSPDSDHKPDDDSNVDLKLSAAAVRKPAPNPKPPTLKKVNGMTVSNESTTAEVVVAAPEVVIPEVNEQAQEAVVLKALYDFTGRETDDLTFSKGDRFRLVHSHENGWWKAKHLETGLTGFVPSTYVARDDSIESHEWWFDMKRAEANKQLILPGNLDGTFLVRESRERNVMALSLRWLNPLRPQDQGIKHYKIHFQNNNSECFITKTKTFASVPELLDYFKENDGLCCKLTKACPKKPEAVPFKELEIAKESIKLSVILGSGHFGDVYKARWRNQIDVAVKTLKPGTMSSEAFLEEAEIMHKLQHPKLVQLMGVCTQDDQMFIITELMVNGSLRDYLREKGKDNVPFMTLIDMATQISDGMSYLEKKNFVHRDVRSANMLVGENTVVKVADFGLARVIEDDEYTATGNKFPVKWTAPEAIHKRIFTTKSDVWSFGILVYELITYGRTPYAGFNNGEVIEKLDKGYRIPKPESFQCPSDVYKKMQQCWDIDPNKRPLFTSLYAFYESYTLPAENGDADCIASNGIDAT